MVFLFVVFRILRLMLLLHVHCLLLVLHLFCLRPLLAQLCCLFQYLLEAELLQVECVWELKLVVQLNVSKLVKVEYDSVEVDDESVWQFLDRQLLLNLYTLAASLTLVVRDDFASN